MIEIERHIEILLLSNDCVIVPGFGGFMAHHVDAYYDEQESIFLPPQRTIGFNPQLVLNDSLLAQSYIEAYDISYPEAICRIMDDVRELKQRIENYGRYELHDLGIISINKYGKFEFQPCEAGILTPELYGFSSYNISSIEAASPIIAKETREMANENVESTESESDAYSILDIKNSDAEDTIRVTTLRNIVVACIAIIAFFVISSPINNGDVNFSKAHINTSMLQKIIPQDVTANSINGFCSPKSNFFTDNSKKNIVDTIKSNETAQIDAYYYTVVLCSKVTVKNAIHYVKQLHEMGLKEAEVLEKANITRVIFGRFKTETEAHTVASKLNNSKEFADCWITKVIN